MRWASLLFVLLAAGSFNSVVVAQPPDLAKLTASLSAGTAEEKHAAADGLSLLGPSAASAVPSLLTALESTDAELRWRAARALGRIGSVQAVPALQKHSADADAAVRAQSLYALGRIGDKDMATLAAVIARLTDSDSRVRHIAITTLRVLKADRNITIPLIIKVLEDSDPDVVIPALHALAEEGAAIVPALIEALEHKEARYWACLVLAEIGPDAKAAVPGLIKALADERPEVRLQATIALGSIGPDAKAAVPAIIKEMSDAQVGVQYAAAYALGRIADPAAAAAIGQAEQSKDPFLHLIGAWAAARLSGGNAEKTKAVVKELVATLIAPDRWHRELAAQALLDLGAPPELISGELDTLTKDLAPEKMDLLVGAFASLGSRVVPRATELLKDPMRRERAMQILSRIGEPAALAVPELLNLLKDADPKVRTEALFVLAAIGPKAEAAVGPATALLADPDRDVKLTAGYALGKIGAGSMSASPALRKLLESDDEMTRLTGVWALLRIDPKNQDLVKAAIPLLTQALKHPYDFVRGEAAISLGDLGALAASALPALEAATHDASPPVRDAAAAAIKKIKGM